MMTDKSEALHIALVAAIRDLRQRGSKMGLTNLVVSIDTEGRVDGDLKITYNVREKYGSDVSGNTLEDVFREMCRRKGWSEAHQPLCLPNVDDGDVHGDFVESRE